MFVTVLPFAVLVLIRGMLVFFVLTPMLVFFPFMFAAAAVMFGHLFRLLAISYCLFLGPDERNQLNSVRCEIISILTHLVML